MRITKTETERFFVAFANDIKKTMPEVILHFYDESQDGTHAEVLLTEPCPLRLGGNGKLNDFKWGVQGEANGWASETFWNNPTFLEEHRKHVLSELKKNIEYELFELRRSKAIFKSQI